MKRFSARIPLQGLPDAGFRARVRVIIHGDRDKDAADRRRAALAVLAIYKIKRIGRRLLRLRKPRHRQAARRGRRSFRSRPYRG